MLLPARAPALLLLLPPLLQDSCRLCFASPHRARHLAIAIGQGSYLALPARGRLVPGHCVLVPAEHVASARQVDEAVWTELRNFKKCLIQMYMKQVWVCVCVWRV